MTTAAYHPSPHEHVAELLSRLRRVDAAGNTVGALATMNGTSSAMLGDALNSLEHDLQLALREAGSARERITR
jgi:hypothetical protein